MSFASDTRDEMVRVAASCNMCDKSTLSALVRIDGTIYLSGSSKYRVEVATDFACIGRFIIQKLHDLYDLKTSISYRRSVLHQTQNYQIDIPYQKNIEFALNDLGILGEKNTLERGISKKLIANDCCKCAYLRGAFLGSGFIAGPTSDHHFEIVLGSQEIASEMINLMKNLNISAHIVKRRNNWMIYMKSGGEIVKFLNIVGATNSASQLEKVLIDKSIRNEINRTTNAEIANLKRTSNAAFAQLEAIETLLADHSIDEFSPAIQSFMKLRLENKGASLSELALLSDPPVSKSAINHRARRVVELAKEGTNSQA